MIENELVGFEIKTEKATSSLIHKCMIENCSSLRSERVVWTYLNIFFVFIF